MLMLEHLAEQRIDEAERQGQFAGLPGEGAPLDLDDDRLIPEDLRMAYRILKNAGYVPPEVTALRELADLEALVRREEGEARTTAMKKLELLRLQLEAVAPARAALLLRDDWRNRLLVRLSGDAARVER